MGNITLTDIDGNIYKTVKIGEQIWMAENLKVGNYKNGEEIIEQEMTDDSCGGIRFGKNRGGYLYYDNNEENNSKQGKLYMRSALEDPRGLAPEGWRIPSKEDWKQLLSELGATIRLPDNNHSSLGDFDLDLNVRNYFFTQAGGNYSHLDGTDEYDNGLTYWTAELNVLTMGVIYNNTGSAYYYAMPIRCIQI